MTDNSAASCRYVFGPVPSRRLGRSLGLDLVPFKTCSYDCVYCQLGQTTNKTITRAPYVPIQEVLQELRKTLEAGPPPDYITLAGSGEPTLFEPIGELIHSIKQLTDIPVAVLTNGSLLWLPEVRAGLAEADLVVPSLDAGSETDFQLVNRPHQAISFQTMTDGLIEFARTFRGRLWLEVFIIGGTAAEQQALPEIARIAQQMKPECIQLNTVTRPPAEAWVQPASPEQLHTITALMGNTAELIHEFSTSLPGPMTEAGEEAVLNLLRRRPCRLEDLATGLGIHRNEVLKYLGHLLRAGQIKTQIVNEQTYYSAVLQSIGQADGE